MSKTQAAMPTLKRVAQFEVNGQIFTTQKEAMAFLHREKKIVMAAAIVSPEKDEAGNPIAWTGESFGQLRPKLEELFAVGTIQRQKKVKVPEKVAVALQALLDQAAQEGGLTAEFLLKNEDAFEAALKANRARPELSEEEKQALRDRLAAHRPVKKAAEATE